MWLTWFRNFRKPCQTEDYDPAIKNNVVNLIFFVGIVKFCDGVFAKFNSPIFCIRRTACLIWWGIVVIADSGAANLHLGFIMVCAVQVLNADFRLYDRLRPKRESTVMHLEVCQNIKLHSCALDIYNFQWEPVFQFDFMSIFTAN